MNLFTYGCLSLVLISDKSVRVEVDEAMLGSQLFSDLLSEFVAVGTRPDMDHSRFDAVVHLLHGLFEGLVCVDIGCVVVLLQEWNQLLGSLCVLLDLLG